jgi:ribosomal protein L44E
LSVDASELTVTARRTAREQTIYDAATRTDLQIESRVQRMTNSKMLGAVCGRMCLDRPW